MIRTIFLSLGLILLASVSGVAQIGKDPAPKAAPTTAASVSPEAEPEMLVEKLKSAELSAQLCTISPENKLCSDYTPSTLSDLYSKIARDPKATAILLARTYESFANMKSGARGAVQVSQAADEAGMRMQLMIIAQNQRIIELLEQLVRKR